MNLVPAYHDALWTRAAPMTPEDIAMHQQTFVEMTELMHSLQGAGLAMPQIGLGLRAFVSKYPDWPVAINPSSLQVANERGIPATSRIEGCLSKPGWHSFVRRSDTVLARWTDAAGKPQEAELAGNFSRVFQHLCDLLDAKPIFPRPKTPALT